MLSVCLVLAGYTLLLHHKLSFAVWFAVTAHNTPNSSVFPSFTMFQEDKRGFTVTHLTVSHDDQVSHLPHSPTTRKPPPQFGILTHVQAGDLQDLPSHIQQKAAMLQNVSGLAEEVSQALVPP